MNTRTSALGRLAAGLATAVCAIGFAGPADAAPAPVHIGQKMTPPQTMADADPVTYGALRVFFRSPTGRLMERWLDGDGWHTADHGGADIIGEPTAVVTPTGLRVYSRYENGQMREDSLGASGSWTVGTPIPGLVFASDFAAIHYGTPRVFGRTSAGALVEAWIGSDNAWHYAGHGGAAIIGNPSAVVDGWGKLRVYSRYTNNLLREDVLPSTAGPWSIGSPAAAYFTSDVTAIVALGSLRVFGRSTTGTLRELWLSSVAGPWSAAEHAGGSMTGKPAAVLASGTLRVYSRFAGNALREDSLACSACAWVTGNPYGAVFTGDPAAIVSVGALRVYGRGTTGTLWELWLSGNGTGPAWSASDHGIPVAA
ncbi:hypothetical protein [Catellatospora bangladeshensis]|uniref:PLL-like beta propeller domain-containing protein n=2 Tax=Catellatospora bangladeshensis TaxID=310355 RepID=A0A8J3JHM4_9ACTN|nr:hypothetical protein [Catellatospora bangladeshensis]GIF80836.1 hypothetical protein Cba03nite_21850 [Catellatospora bangladeshensis]